MAANMKKSPVRRELRGAVRRRTGVILCKRKCYGNDPGSADHFRPAMRRSVASVTAKGAVASLAELERGASTDCLRI